MWTLDLDDFNNLCCQGQYPLLNTISKKLRGVGGAERGCGRPAPPVTPAPSKPETTTYDDGSSGGGWKDPLASEQWPSSSTTKRTTTTQRTTTTKRTTTTTESDVRQCVEGSYYEYPKDCQKYYFCGNGKLILQACSAGLYWSSEAQMCDWNDNVRCDKDNVVEIGGGGTPEVSPVEAEVIDYNDYNDYNDNSDNNGGGCTEGEYSSSSSSCSTFYQCVNGKKTLKNCYEGLHWNSATNTCDWPEAAGCTGAQFRTGLTREAGACTEGDLDIDPENCANYLFCVHGEMEQFSCQSGTVWDNALKVCNFPDQVSCSAPFQSGSGSVSEKPDNKPAIESGVVLVVGDRNIEDNQIDNNDSNNYDYDDNDDSDNNLGIPSGADGDNVIENYPTTPQGLSGDYKVPTI